VTRVGPDSPFHAGTIAFFGHMASMTGMSADATFAVPLPKNSQAFPSAEALKSTPVNIRIVPSNAQGQSAATSLKSVIVRAR
jgi:tyrosinase